MKTLGDKRDDLRPVWYIPRIFQEDLAEYIDGPGQPILKKYVKIPSGGDEQFSLIYREREWRIPSDFQFDDFELNCLIVQTNTQKAKIIRDPRIQKMLLNGLSIISFEDHFEEVKEVQ